MKRIILIMFLLLSTTAQADNSGTASYVCHGISVKNEEELCVSRAIQVIDGLNKVTTSRESEVGSRGLVSLFWPWAWWFLYYGFGILIGLYIFKDCKSREWVFLGIKPVFWLILASFDPAITLIAYWLLHYSRFSMSYSEAISTVHNPSNKE